MVENDLTISSQELRAVAFHRTLHKFTSLAANADHDVCLFVTVSPSSYSFLTFSLFLREEPILLVPLPFSLSGEKPFFILVI